MAKSTNQKKKSNKKLKEEEVHESESESESESEAESEDEKDSSKNNAKIENDSTSDEEDEKDVNDDDDNDDDESDGDDNSVNEEEKNDDHDEDQEDNGDDESDVDNKDSPKDASSPEEVKKPKKVKKLDLTKVEDFNAKLRRRGVLYLSHIPPQMGPNKVKTLLSTFGAVTRVYLVPEDPSARKRRQQQTGKKGGSKRYVEGWVEFESRKVAKHVGMNLNNTPISNFKRSVHYGQMWNVKFLRKFQWSHLTEKVAYERRVREHKLKIEMMQVKKENASYKNLVERGQVMDRIEARKKRKNSSAEGYAKKFKFRQNKPMGDNESSTKAAVLGSLMKS